MTTNAFHRFFALPDLAVCVLYAGLAYLVLRDLWVDPNQRSAVPPGLQDKDQTEWFLSNTAYAIFHGDNPFFSHQMNVPDGVNMMANTSVIALGTVTAPLTWWAGPHWSYLILLTAGLIGTAIGWYFFARRWLDSSRIAAAVAGGLCGFGPGLISQANGHLNFAFQVLVPIIVWRVLALYQRPRWVNSVWLAVVVVVQFFIGEEVLSFTALGIGVVSLCYAAGNWRQVRTRLLPFLGWLALAAIIALPILFRLLLFQFYGPQHYTRIPGNTNDWGADLVSFIAVPTQSIGGWLAEELGFDEYTSEQLAFNATEANTFFGVLLVLAGAIVVWQCWRVRIVLPLAITAVLFAVMALGPELMVNDSQEDVTLPWAYVGKLALLNHVVPVRFGLVILPCLALLLAIGIDHIRGWLRIPWFIIVAIGLVTLIPLAAPMKIRKTTPEFFTTEQWRPYIVDGRSVVTIPLPAVTNDSIRWAAESRAEFPLARGYFLGPVDEDGRAGYEPPPRFTSTLLDQIAHGLPVPELTQANREQMRKDLRFWRAGVVVLPPQRHQDKLLATMTEVLGPAQQRNGVWLWDTRGL